MTNGPKRSRTIDRLERDGLIEFGSAVAELLESNPDLHALIQPFLATAVQRKLDAPKLIALLLEHIQYDSSHPLYLWVMELRIRLGLANTEPVLDDSPSIEIVATVDLVSKDTSAVYRRPLPTLPDPGNTDDLPDSQRPTLVPAELPSEKRD